MTGPRLPRVIPPDARMTLPKILSRLEGTLREMERLPGWRALKPMLPPRLDRLFSDYRTWIQLFEKSGFQTRNWFSGSFRLFMDPAVEKKIAENVYEGRIPKKNLSGAALDKCSGYENKIEEVKAQGKKYNLHESSIDILIGMTHLHLDMWIHLLEMLNYRAELIRALDDFNNECTEATSSVVSRPEEQTSEDHVVHCAAAPTYGVSPEAMAAARPSAAGLFALDVKRGVKVAVAVGLSALSAALFIAGVRSMSSSMPSTSAAGFGTGIVAPAGFDDRNML